MMVVPVCEARPMEVESGVFLGERTGSWGWWAAGRQAVTVS